ncbi:MAG: hypothetical protein ACWGNS_08750 [Burkholderiales bacterium]
MSGAYLLGLIGISMASLFAVAGLVINFQVWRAARRAKAGERVASGIPILPGVVGSVTLFFLIPQLKARFGIELPWPFFWILLPLVLDLQGLGGWLLALVGLRGGAPASRRPDGGG